MQAFTTTVTYTALTELVQMVPASFYKGLFTSALAPQLGRSIYSSVCGPIRLKLYRLQSLSTYCPFQWDSF